MLKNSYIHTAFAIALLLVSAFIFPSNALAFDENYIDNQSAWYRKGETVQVKDGSFSGQLKYISDDSEGCVYFYLSVSDKALKELSDDECALSFTLENSAHSYAFAVNKVGITDDSESEASTCFEVYPNFAAFNSSNGGGYILVGFELKNADDKKLLNKISCSFVSSAENVIELKSGIELDMYVPTTTKTTTAKTAKGTTKPTAKSTKETTVKTTKEKTTKQTTSKTTKQKTTKTTTKKSTSTTKKSLNAASKSTKFKPKQTTKRYTARSSTKFIPSTGEATQSGTVAESETSMNSEKSTKFKASATGTTKSSTAMVASDIKRTKAIRSALILAMLFLIFGLTFLLLGLLLSGHQLINKDDADKKNVKKAKSEKVDENKEEIKASDEKSEHESDDNNEIPDTDTHPEKKPKKNKSKNKKPKQEKHE